MLLHHVGRFVAEMDPWSHLQLFCLWYCGISESGLEGSPPAGGLSQGRRSHDDPLRCDSAGRSFFCHEEALFQPCGPRGPLPPYLYEFLSISLCCYLERRQCILCCIELCMLNQKMAPLIYKLSSQKGHEFESLSSALLPIFRRL